MKDILRLIPHTILSAILLTALFASCGRAVPSDNDTNIEPAQVIDDSTTIIVSENSIPPVNEIGDAVDQATRSLRR